MCLKSMSFQSGINTGKEYILGFNTGSNNFATNSFPSREKWRPSCRNLGQSCQQMMQTSIELKHTVNDININNTTIK